jgi:hypothetical protein
MSAPTHTEVAIETEPIKECSCNRNPGTVGEWASFSEPGQRPSTVGRYVLDDRTFETFIDGAGI